MYVWLVMLLVIVASILLAVGTIWFVNRVSAIRLAESTTPRSHPS